MTVKIIALVVLALVYLYGMLLRWIDRRSENNPVPANVADVYDPETYRKWRAYHTEKSRVGMIDATVAFAVDFLLLLLNGYAALARLFPQGPFWQMFAVFLASAIASLAQIPVSWYDTMVVEEKYGFNRSTAKTFWVDQVKNLVVNLLFMTLIGALLMSLHRLFGDAVIIAFAAAMTLVMLGITFLYPVFSRFFNKFSPLEEGELKEKITALLEKNGYRVRAIQVMDASRRSTKSNAYFTGFGKMKTIVLYDTLVSSMTTEEICAVFAHEMGHGLHRDTLKRQLLSFAQMLLLGVLAWLTLRTESLFPPFGFEGVNYGFALLLMMSVEFALVSPLVGLVMNAVSRRAEYRADAQAVREGYGAALVSALKTLARSNFADLAPDPLLVRLEASHPTLSQRIAAIEKAR